MPGSSDTRPRTGSVHQPQQSPSPDIIPVLDSVVNRLPNSVSEGLHDHLSTARDSLGRWSAGVHSMLTGLQSHLDQQNSTLRQQNLALRREIAGRAQSGDGAVSSGEEEPEVDERSTLIDMRGGEDLPAAQHQPQLSSTSGTTSYHRWPASQHQQSAAGGSVASPGQPVSKNSWTN
jgi:hypothetical protein